MTRKREHSRKDNDEGATGGWRVRGGQREGRGKMMTTLSLSLAKSSARETREKRGNTIADSTYSSGVY